jgi:hypothetical protein
VAKPTVDSINTNAEWFFCRLYSCHGLFETVLGKEHPSILAIMNDLAGVLSN